MEAVFPYSPIKIQCQSGPFWPLNHPAKRIGSAPLSHLILPLPLSHNQPQTQHSYHRAPCLPHPSESPRNISVLSDIHGVLVSPITLYSGRREATEAQKIIERGSGLCGQEKAPGRCGVGLGCVVFTPHYSWDSRFFRLSSYQYQKMMCLDNRSCVHSTLCYRNLCFLLCRIC